MWPVVFQLGVVTIYSFGFLLVLACVLGLFVSWKKIVEYHIDDREFFDSFLLVIFGGLVGARVVYLIEHSASFGMSPLKWIWFTQYTGLSMWGSLLGGVAILVFLCWQKRRDVFVWLDIAALGGGLGLVVGRIAALLNGTGLGKPSLIGVLMVGAEGRVLPIQLFEAVGLLLVFLWLWKLEPKYKTIEWYRAGKSTAKSGFLWFMFMALIGIVFFVSSFGYQGGVELMVKRVFAISSLVFGMSGIYIRSGRTFLNDLKLLQMPFRKKK